MPFFKPSTLKNMLVVYVHIQNYTNFQENRGGGGDWNPPPPGPYGTEKSMVLRGLKMSLRSAAEQFYVEEKIYYAYT